MEVVPLASRAPVRAWLDYCRCLVRRPVEWLPRGLRDFVYGMTAYEFVHHAQQERARLEDLFVLLTLGDMIGVPILPPYYSLRLVPYAVGQVEGWKRRMLRERHALEHEEFDMIEM